MLPYASYLRVYEPLDAFHETVRSRLAFEVDDPLDTTSTIASEQRTALTRVVTATSLQVEVEQSAGAYVLQAEGLDFFCPLDLSLRSWLALTELVSSIGDSNVGLIFPAQTLASAGDDFLRWRRDHPHAVPHIRQSTWGVPRTWFVLVDEGEREPYDEGGLSSVRYRARVLAARRRVDWAHRILRSVIDDGELLEELRGLGVWLGQFDQASWVELDYAGVAGLLGDQLSSDESARDIHSALAALKRRDFVAAEEAYRSFESRWRPVHAFERAN